MDIPWLPIWLLLAPIIAAILSLGGTGGVRSNDRVGTNYSADSRRDVVEG